MTNKLEKVSFIVFIITILLAPLAFLPSVYAPLDMIKTFVIVTGVLLSSILYLISIFKTRSLYIPKHPLVTLSCVLMLSLLISTILSSSPLKSFLGQGFEIGTLSFILTLFVSGLLTVYLSYKNRDKILYVYGTVFISFVLVSFFQLIRFFFGSDILVFDVFHSSLLSVLGRLMDFGVMAGIIFIISYTALRFVLLKRLYRFVFISFICLAIFSMFIVDSPLIWGSMTIILAIIGFFEFHLIHQSSIFVRRIPFVTIIFIALSVLFTMNGSTITERVLGKLNISQTEVTLPWQYTLDITTGTIKNLPLFGAGSNRFATEYLKYKPLIINQTMYWNTEFAQGFGWIPTFAVTSGLIGLSLWIILILIFCGTGLKALKNSKDDLMKFIISSTFFSALFFWLMLFVYIPSHTILFFTFVFSGLFVAALIQEGNILLINIGAIQTSILRKFTPLVIVLAIVIAVLWLCFFLKKMVALSYFQSGIISLNMPNNTGLQKAEENFKKALAFDRADTYYQALSEVDIIKISLLATQLQAESQKSGKNPKTESVAQLTNLISEARGYIQLAIVYDPTNYYNYIAQSRISEIALSLQIPEAYEQVIMAYNNALKYNPNNPSLYLNMARIEASQNKLADAQRDIGFALQLKPNYLDAIFLLSQIQVNQGQIKDAITSVKVASQINPASPQIFFQLGFLYYNDKNYTLAIDTLNQAIKLDEQYANARYFLGLSYARVNKIADAIIQFEALSVSNPDNKEVALILSNLRSGRSPFTDAKAPLDSKPEQRKNLPIKGK
jgi:tetratricopeptide (TPR) repeat protein